MNKIVEDVVEELREVRKTLTDVGWCQGYYRAFDDGNENIIAYCLSGACNKIAKHKTYVRLAQVLNEAIKARHPKYESPLARRPLEYVMIKFNDAKGRTKEEVVTGIDDAIALVEEAK